MERWYPGPRWALQVYWKASLYINTQFPLSAQETMTAVYKVHVTSPRVLFDSQPCALFAVLALVVKASWCGTPQFSGVTFVHFNRSENVCNFLCSELRSCIFSPGPPRGRRGRNAATLRQAPWPCCFIILLTVVLKALKYWTEHERWGPPSLPSLVVLFRVEDSESHASTAGLFRLTPRTITLVKEEEICVFTCDKCAPRTALSVLSTSLSHVM